MFSFPVPYDEVICTMKLSTMISRQKGREFYDALLLLAQTKPDYSFLSLKSGIHSLEELKVTVAEILKAVDLNKKNIIVR